MAKNDSTRDGGKALSDSENANAAVSTSPSAEQGSDAFKAAVAVWAKQKNVLPEHLAVMLQTHRVHETHFVTEADFDLMLADALRNWK